MTATASLELFARIHAAWIALAVLAQAPRQLAWVGRRGNQRETPRLLGLRPVPRLGPTPTGVVAAMLIASLSVLALGGAWGGIAACFAAGAALLFFAQIIELPDVRRKPGTVPVILLVAGAALLVPGAAREAVAASALFTIKAVVALVYLSSGLVKLRTVGWSWGAGDAVQLTLLRYHLRHGASASRWFAGRPAVCRALATGTLIFELTFWLMIPFPTLAWLYLPAGIAFHAGTAVLMRIHYWIYLMPAYWVFVRC